MKILIAALIMLTTTSALAELKNSFIDTAIGYPYDNSIENPDGTKAYYDGVAFRTAFNYNFAYSRSDTAYGFTLHYKYLKIDNTKSSSVTESAVHKGLGIGVFAMSSGFYLGLNYGLMKASHQSSGNVSAFSEFNYNPITVDLSYTINYGSMVEIGPAISYAFTDLSKKETGLSKDCPYNEQIIWLKLIFWMK